MPICKAFWDGFVLHWSGAVFPCSILCTGECMNSLFVGSLGESSLADLHRSERAREMRRQFARGEVKSLCCSHCGKGELCGSYVDETVGSLASLSDEGIENLYPVARLEVSLTDNCNMLCIMCAKTVGVENPPGLGRSGFIETGLLKRALAEFRDLSNGAGTVYLHWIGEPTLHADFAEILRTTNDLGLKFALITNGILFSRELSDLVVSLEKVGLVSFSLNSGCDETYRVVNNSKQYPRVLANIEYLLDRRRDAGRTLDLPVAVTFVVLKENLEEAVSFRDSWFDRFRGYGAVPSLCFNGRGAISASQVMFLREAGHFSGSEQLFNEASARLGPASAGE